MFDPLDWQRDFIGFNIFIFKPFREFRKKYFYIDKPLTIIAKVVNFLLNFYPIFKLFFDIIVSND